MGMLDFMKGDFLDSIRSRKAKINNAAGLTPKAKAAKKKKRRTNVSQFSASELESMSDKDFLKLQQ